MLRFSPQAWAKLMYFRDQGDCEIGGFGVCVGDDLLLVTDFVTVGQNVSVGDPVRAVPVSIVTWEPTYAVTSGDTSVIAVETPTATNPTLTPSALA